MHAPARELVHAAIVVDAPLPHGEFVSTAVAKVDGMSTLTGQIWPALTVRETQRSADCYETVLRLERVREFRNSSNQLTQVVLYQLTDPGASVVKLLLEFQGNPEDWARARCV